ncbi:alpha/beta hydrolase [Saccharothrix algeriensis]|uniref:Alpha/beta fold hydrolase n=1 Tax=Saccharothrix algeriensis TaxID=173560 RepID=A0A8T8I154_9PSEU|nr:alpha/beta fold hydrolase [Saccharothrix algeriensis]MBM7810385.1 pimeloyl-ACP methyl ester carboxylesterase [Saccharothrix algeriensis]QTR04522.1 alpha/beta fold hydrolase [Saccharothrix algeriensis]
MSALLSTLLTPYAPLHGAFLSYLIYHPPRRRDRRAPAEVGLTPEDLVVPLPGGGRLAAWLFRNDPERVVVVGHGIGLSRSASLRHAKFLHEAGYTVVLFDHRNHGRSSQDRAFWKLGHRFTTDVVTVVEHVRALPGHADARFAVYGFSFSTFPVSYVPTRPEARVSAIVCDSGPVVDIPSLFRGFLDTDGIPVPAALRRGPARRALEGTFAALGTGMLQAQWPPPVEPYADTPVLFLAGEDDVVVPAAGVRELARRFPLGQFRSLPGTGHLAGLKTLGDTYSSAVLDFLAAAFERPVRNVPATREP